jgi:hypothetical protein
MGVGSTVAKFRELSRNSQFLPKSQLAGIRWETKINQDFWKIKEFIESSWNSATLVGASLD